ncbi:protein GL2-INTERACTING REPRESSOR 2-like [Vicia villosa]|uniref:protein GL2-INTERACTING REPRESSOR 2-like n=1 Tax=Vicia villosa TaxID=3911 RepID=UPI00273AFF18|nr:protein GL2-INTERACTING REPRESSOR 2-like [Vicia villosa]
MSKRKSRESELSPPPPESAKSLSPDLPELLSSSSSSSSKSYSSKMIVHEVTSMATKQDDNEEEYAKAVTKEMVLVGCPKCYMYVMSSEDEPKCPKCKTTVFLDLFGDED